MTLLITTDIHLSDKPKDSYRFGLFDFLNKERERHKVSLILILGDITDKKDNHSSKLVNQIVEGFHLLAKEVPVIILKGNHDYHTDPDNPFFDFLNKMKNIRFITKPATWLTSEGSNLVFLPHTKDEKAWNSFRLDVKPSFAFIHQTVAGAISESGRRLDGFSLKPLKRFGCPVYAGDVHKPHTIDVVTYVGPPYHVRFGDDFIPRCLVLNEETGKAKDINFECPRKWSIQIREPEELLSDKRLKAGDQCKVSLELLREEIPEWPVLKDRIVSILKELKLEPYGIELKIQKTQRSKKEHDIKIKEKTPTDILSSFCKREKLAKNIREIGLDLLKD